MPVARLYSYRCQGQDLHLQHTGSEPASSADWDTLAGGCGRIRTGTKHVLDVLPLPKVGVRSRSCCGRESNPGLAPIRRQRGLIRPAARPRAAAASLRSGRESNSPWAVDSRPASQMRTGPTVRECRRLDLNQQTLPSEGCAHSTWRRRVRAMAPGVRLARTTSGLTGRRLCFEATLK